jgi:hypothetical protein
MLIQSANLVKEIAFAMCVRGGNTKKRLSTMLSRIPFRHPTQFQLNKLLRQPRTTTEKCAVFNGTSVDSLCRFVLPAVRKAASPSKPA